MSKDFGLFTLLDRNNQRTNVVSCSSIVFLWWSRKERQATKRSRMLVRATILDHQNLLLVSSGCQVT